MLRTYLGLYMFRSQQHSPENNIYQQIKMQAPDPNNVLDIILFSNTLKSPCVRNVSLLNRFLNRVLTGVFINFEFMISFEKVF